MGFKSLSAPQSQQQTQIPESPEMEYTWESARKDPELISAIKRYAFNTEKEAFKSDEQAFDWFVGDRRWKDANTVSSLKELNKAKRWYGTHASDQDLKDLSVMRERWEKLPGGISRMFDGDIVGGAGAIAENIGKGLVDPTIIAGGWAGKGAAALLGQGAKQGIKNVARAGSAIATDAAITAGANVGFQEANVELGLQKDIDPWSALAAGGLGAVLSAPGHISVNTKTQAKPDIAAAAKQAKAGAENLKKQGQTSVFTEKQRENMLPAGEEIPTPKVDDSEPDWTTLGQEAPNLNTLTEAKLKEANSLEATLSSKLKLPLADVEKTSKKVLDYVSGRMVRVNDTNDMIGLMRDVETEFGSTLFTKDKNQGKQTWASTMDAAKKGLQGKDLEQSAKAITNLPVGYNPNAVEAKAVDIVRGALYNKWDEAATKLAADPTNKALARETQRLFEMWGDLETKRIAMGSEAGRALRVRAYTTNTPENIFGKAAEALAKGTNVVSGNKSKFDISPDEALQVHAAIKDLGGDPLATDLFLTNLENSKSGFKDAVWEAWYNSLLSGPSTMVINTLGNAVTTGINIVENSLADPKNANYLVAGYLKSIPEAFKVALRTFRTEIPNDAATRLEVKNSRAIPSYVWDGEKEGLWRFRKAGLGESWQFGGKQVRIFGRMLMATDDFSKVGHYRAALTDAAVREIKAAEATSGTQLTKDEFNKQLNDMVSNPTTKMSDYASEVARRLTYTDSPGKIGRSIQQIVDDIPGGRLVVPFVRTPANILRYAADMVLPMTERNKKGLQAGGHEAAKVKARLMMGWSIMAAGAWANASGNATGAGPSDPAERSTWMANNLPWSIKAGNQWIQWNRLDPVALPFAIGTGAVDVVKAMNDPAREDAFYETVAKLFSDAVLDKTWFQGVQNVMNAITDPEVSGEGFVNGIARTFVPSIVAGSARAFDPRVTAPMTFMEVIQDRIGFDSRKKIPTKLDIWGREIHVEVLGDSIAGPLARLVSPFKTKAVESDPVVSEMDNLRIKIQPPSKRWHGEELTSDQYYIYSKARGQYMYNAVRWAQSSPEWKNMNPGIKRNIVEAIKNEASQVADIALYGTYPDKLKQRLLPENNAVLKQFKTPTQQELNQRLLSPGSK